VTNTIFLSPLGTHTGTVAVAGFPSTTHAYVGSASGCAGGTCSATVTFPASYASYGARITSVYRDAPNTTISGTLASNAAATFSGAQAVVDTTGQAQDQLRRIQVRVQLSAAADANTIPGSVVSSSTDLCKHFSIVAGNNVDPTNLCQ
jgi:hypothetical protein